MRRLEDRRDTLERRTLISGLATAIQSVRGVFTFLVARLMGEVAVGLLSVAWSWTDLLSKFGTWGLDQATTIHVAGSLARERPGQARQIHRRALITGVARSLVVAAVVSTGLLAAASRLGWRAGGADGLLILIWALPFVAAWRISNAASWGSGCLHHNIYSKGLTESGVTTLSFLIAYLVGVGITAPLYAVICGYGAGCVVASWLARRRLVRQAAIEGDGPEGDEAARGVDRSEVDDAARNEDRSEVDDAAIERLRESARAIGWNDLFYLLNLRMDVIVLSLFAGTALTDWIPSPPGLDLATIGAYGVAVELAWGVRKVKTVFEPVYTPLLAGVAARREFEEPDGTPDRSSVDGAGLPSVLRWMLTAQLGLIGLLALAGAAVLRIFGPYFPVAAPWLAVLAFSNLMNGFVLSDASVNVLRPRLNIVNGAVGAAANLALNLALIPILGPVGAAIATLVAFGLQTAMRLWQIEAILDLGIPWRRLARPAGAFLVAFAPTAGVLLLRSPGLAGRIGLALLYLVGFALVNLGASPGDTLTELRLMIARIRRGRNRE